MKDVTFGAVQGIAGGKAGMDDNSESGMLFFAPSNKGETLFSQFCIPICTNCGSISISIEFLI